VRADEKLTAFLELESAMVNQKPAKANLNKKQVGNDRRGGYFI